MCCLSIQCSRKTYPFKTLDVTDFKAIPDDGKEDTQSFIRALDQMRKMGYTTLLIPKGVYEIGSIDIFPGIHMKGEDGTILKKIGYAGKWSRMLTTQNINLANYKNEVIEISNLIFDGNVFNQGKFRNHELGQQHLIFLTGKSIVGSRLNAIIRDCEFHDSAADAISIHKNVNATVNNCLASNIFRGGLVLTGGNSVVDVDSFQTKGDLIKTGIDVEVDGRGSDNLYNIELTMNHVLLDGDLDIASRSNSRIHIKNAKIENTPVNIVCKSGSITIEDSEFLITEKGVFTIQYPENVVFKNCNFINYSFQDKINASIKLIWKTKYLSPTDQKLAFIDCDFTNRSNNLVDGYYFHSHLSDYSSNNSLNFSNCHFNQIKGVLNAEKGGLYFFNNCFFNSDVIINAFSDVNDKKQVAVNISNSRIGGNFKNYLNLKTSGGDQISIEGKEIHIEGHLNKTTLSRVNRDLKVVDVVSKGKR